MNWLLTRLPPSLVRFLRLSRPVFLLGGILLYALGAGIANYLGNTINWAAYWLGQACVTLLQLSAQYLNEYFDADSDRDNPNRTFLTGGSGERGLPRQTALLAAIATLSVWAIITVLLYANGYLGQALLIVLSLAFLGSIFYSTPPVRLVSTGYGELVASILVANLVPAFAFILQAGSLHRLVAVTTTPLTLLHIAMLIAFSLPDYASDLKTGKRSLVIRLGWQKGMQIHNILIVAAYLFLIAASLYGVSLALIWPGFITLPFAVFQVWYMIRLADGAPARWTLLTVNALIIFAATAYFLTLAFWTG